jgi:hypothetical protein
MRSELLAGGSAQRSALPQNRSGIQPALERALTFLSERQLPSGEFRPLMSIDPTLAQGCEPDPSVFPTAVIAHALSFAPGAARVHERACAFLLHEMDADGFWCHWTRDHPRVDMLPPDLDDTCCASAVLSKAGHELPAHRAVILDNRDHRGLFYSWITLRPLWGGAAYWKVTLRQLRRLHMLMLFFKITPAQLNDVDGVVNANTLFYLRDFAGRQKVVEHLLGVLRDGGEADCDKWYANPFVIWYFFGRALGDDTPEARALILQRLAAAQAASVLDHALAACTLFYCGARPGEQVIAKLLSTQLDCGGWPRATFYFGGRDRWPDGSFRPPWPQNPHWGSEELTTAVCIEALSRWVQS